MEDHLRKVFDAIIRGDASVARNRVQSCLERGVDPKDIMEQGLIAAMTLIGERFKKDEIFLPEVMIAARAMNAGLEILDPILGKSEIHTKGKIVLGTVRDDLHDVGKNIVSMMFRGAGFTVIDLGISVPEEQFVNAINEHHPDILGLSALLSMTLPMMKSSIELMEESGLREDTIVMVGGAPVTEAFAQEIGADGYAPDAASAVDRAKELMEARLKSST